jgi:hypothetical protein
MQASNKRPPAKKRLATKATLHFRGGGGFSVSIADEAFAALNLSNTCFAGLREIRARREKLLASSPQDWASLHSTHCSASWHMRLTMKAIPDMACRCGCFSNSFRARHRTQVIDSLGITQTSPRRCGESASAEIKGLLAYCVMVILSHLNI